MDISHYLIVKTTQIGSYISVETKVASYGSSDNYKFSYSGGIDLEYNKEGRIVLEINLEGIDEHKEKCIDLNGKVDFGDFINELTFSSMCKIEALNQYKILNSELVYSKITEDEIPDINDNEDTLLNDWAIALPVYVGESNTPYYVYVDKNGK